MTPIPCQSMLPLDAEPWRYPDVFDAEDQAQQNFHRQSQHQDQQQIGGYDLQQGHAAENTLSEIGGVHHEIDKIARENEIDGNREESENDARKDRRISAIRRRHQM